VATGTDPRSSGRGGAALMSIAGFAVAAGAYLAMGPGGGPPGRFVPGAAPALWLLGMPVIGLVLCAGLLLRDERPGSAVGVVLIGAGWLGPVLAFWADLPVTVRTWLLAAPALAVAGAALLVASWGARSSTGSRWMRWAARLALAGGAIHLLGYDPFTDPGCRAVCQPAPALLSGVLGNQTVVGLSSALTFAAASLTASGLWRGPGSPGPLRAAAGIAVALVAGVALGSWATWGDPPRPAIGDGPRMIGAALVAGFAVLIITRARTVRREVRAIVRLLETAGGVDTLQGLQFRLPGDGWIDSAGRPVPSEPEHVVDVDAATGTRLVLNRPARADDVDAALTPTGRLVVENARLRALGRARIAELRAAQQRIVAASDAERRRIERDLHDGAQQRLVSVALLLQPALAADADTAVRATAARRHVGDALTALRTLAHGVGPDLLDSEGLGPMVKSLVGGSAVPVDLELHLSGRPVPPQVAMASYAAVAAALDNVARHSGAADAAVRLADGDGVLVVQVSDAGRGGARMGPGLTDVADRVGAGGGELQLTSPPGGGTTMTVRLPCG
jgi:signal transduction histidine kinase